MKKYFGTDGIRGPVGFSPITPEFILKLGWAVGRVLKQHSKEPKVLLGKDTRVSGYLFESALEAGLCAAGININLLGPMPTPAVAYLTRAFRADVGIVISASHNPFQDNGFKFFNAQGLKISDEFELAIEHELAQPLIMVSADQIGKASRIDDAAGRYIEFCKGTFSNHLSLHGIKIVVDCANGATYHVAPYVFRELGAEVIEMNTSPDGFNINEQCGATNTAALKTIVLAEGADLGIALDGDGDRVMMIDAQGNLVDGDQLLYIIVMHAQKMNRLTGGVVGTEMSNLGLEKALTAHQIEFVRAKVGDRYVMELLKQKKWLFGGEGSGHVVCLDLTSTGDGIISALQVLAAMMQQSKTLYALANEWHKLPQQLVNIRCDQPKAVLHSARVQKAIKQLEEALGEKGRCLIRASGTEPVIRVMLEAEDFDGLRKDADHFIELLQSYKLKEETPYEYAQNQN